MTLDAVFMFFISLLLMWIKPGPAQLLKITTALDRGFLPAICISLGSIIICSMFFVLAGLGYKVLTDVFNYAGFFLQIGGAAYLIYLSVKGFLKSYRGGSASKKEGAHKETKASLVSCFLIGVGITISNPFWIFYFIGILPSLLPLGALTIYNFAQGAFLVFLSGIIVDGPMLLLITQVQKNFAGERIAKAIQMFVNFSFLVIAGFLIYSAFFIQEFKFNIYDVL